MSDWKDQEVRNEVRSRNRNEWTEEDRGPPEAGIATQVYVCECGDASCREHVNLTLPEYEAVRGYATRFVIAADHENPEIDQVVSEGPRFTVVQKIAGRPAQIARQTNPRHRGAR